MEGGRLGQINMNNEGLIYLNNNLKVNAIKVALLKRLGTRNDALIKQCERCQSDQCLTQTEAAYQSFRYLKQRVESGVDKCDEQFGYDYHLCGQLIYDNDIKICRRKIKSKYVDKLKVLLTKEIPS